MAGESFTHVCFHGDFGENKMRKLLEYFEITIGAALIAIALEVFYVPHNLVTGGVTGIGIMLLELFNLPLWITNLGLNLPMMILGYKILGKDLFFKSLYATFAITSGLSYAQHIPPIYPDITLSVVFGGSVMGAGTGLILRKAATSGGTSLMAALIGKLMKYVKLTTIIFWLDFVIILGGLIMFGPINTMYAIITIFVTIKVTDVVIQGFQQSKALFILSDKSEEVSQILIKILGRGVTSLPAKGMYTGKNRNMLLCVMSQKEMVRAKEIIKETDPGAFVMVTSVTEVLGEGFTPLR